ncbi:MAG: PKD domain-containing protein [Gammaproteobacteria bacterium]|jgi:hypothetical protein|nr:PKD domain-containing protein [Gammaproteobacteria bacterium]
MQKAIFRPLSAIVVSALLLAACDSSNDNNSHSPTPPPVELPDVIPLEGEPCTANPGATMFITMDCVDPEFKEAYIDVDEVRSTTDGVKNVTVSYRYVHGGFTDTNARFAFYFPASDEYQGRFFESTYPTVAEEGADDGTIAFGISNGAYVVSSNNAGGVAVAQTTGGYRVNAASAKVSRMLAAIIYGEDAPIRGYIYGASGGSLQTIGAAENTAGIWDGALPIVSAPPNAIPSFQSVQVLALRVLHDKLPDIVDAVEPGGSGDPYATLNEEQRAILKEATRLGFPLGGWWQWKTIKSAFGVTVPAVKAIDSKYTNDFWNLPGYAGFDDPTLPPLRTQLDTSIAGVGGGTVTLQDTPTGYLAYADLVINSGAVAGKTIEAVSISGNKVTFPRDVDATLVEALAPGDQVLVDNSLWIALEYFQRHQVPSPDQYGWNQYRDSNGDPIYLQRPALVGEIITQVFGGRPSGQFHGKMIMLSSMLDVQAFPWGGDWHLKQAQTVLGDKLDDSFRHWYMDNADHEPPATIEGYAHNVLYAPEVEQALLDLDAWVANGVAPPKSSGYTVTEDNQIDLADTVDERGGVQPLVTLAVAAADQCDSASDAVRADVRAGAPVSFSVFAATPPGAGKIVRVEWDFESTGAFPDASEFNGPSEDVELCRTHTYSAPGTYFAVVRVTAHREGDPDAVYRQIQNLARVRVVVD